MAALRAEEVDFRLAWQGIDGVVVVLGSSVEGGQLGDRVVVHQAGHLIVAEAEIEVHEGLVQRLMVDAVTGQLDQVAAGLDALAELRLEKERLDVMQLNGIVLGDGRASHDGTGCGDGPWLWHSSVEGSGQARSKEIAAECPSSKHEIGGGKMWVF